MTARASPSILSKGFFWFLFCFQSRNVKSVLSVQSVVKEEKPEDMNPSHPSYLYDSWLKWGKKGKCEVKNGWALMYFLMGSR